MSRSGYTDDMDDTWSYIQWRGQVAACIRGKRGQAFLLEMWRAMQSLPVHRLTKEELMNEYDGSVCALGSVGKARGLDMSNIDIEDHDAVAAAFAIPHQLAREIMYLNDDGWWRVTPEERFTRMKKWIEHHLRPIVHETD